MDTTRFSRLGATSSLVAGPALLAAAAVTLPWTGGGGAEEALARAAEHRTATNVGDLLLFLGLLASIPAAIAVMRLLRRRAPALGLLGGSATIAGLVAWMLTVVTDQVNVALSGTDVVASEIASGFEGSSAWVLWIVLAVMLLGSTVGGLALGAGVLRARIVAPWAGWALVAAQPLAMAGNVAGLKPVAVAGVAATLAGYAAIARLVAGVADEAWESGELPAVPPSARVVPAR